MAVSGAEHQDGSAATVGMVEASSSSAVATSPAAAPASAVLRLRGLPYAATEDDIKAFFEGHELLTVFLCKRNGRATGEAYVQLQSPAAAAEASTKLNRQNIGHRYIEIFDSSEADLQTAKQMSVDRLRGFVLRLRGLPFTASASDVLRFLEAIEVVRGIEGVVFTYTPDGRPTGECYVEVKDEESQKEALKKHKETIGTRYIEVFISTKADMIQAIQQNRLILGYANRKRWMQANVGAGGAGVGAHVPMPMPHYGPPRPHGPMHPPPGAMGPRGPYAVRPPGVDEVSEMFTGFNLGPQGMQVMTHNGQQLPPGTYQIEVPADAMRGGRGGRGGGGRGGVYGSAGLLPGGPAAGRGQPYGMRGGGRVGPQYGMGRGAQQHMAQQVMSVAPQNTQMLLQPQGHQQYIIQPPSQGRQRPGHQHQPQYETMWSQPVGMGAVGMQQGPQHGSYGYAPQQQQQGGAYHANSSALHVSAPQQGGTYTLATIQIPGGAGQAGAQAEYQPQLGDVSQLGGGLQQVDLAHHQGHHQQQQAIGGGLHLEVPHGAHMGMGGGRGDMLLSSAAPGSSRGGGSLAQPGMGPSVYGQQQ